MLGILQPKIRPLQKIDPTLFLFRIVALRAVGLEKGLNREGFQTHELHPLVPGNVLENMVTGRLLPICSRDKGKQANKTSTNQGIRTKKRPSHAIRKQKASMNEDNQGEAIENPSGLNDLRTSFEKNGFF